MEKLIEVARGMIKPQMTVSFGGGRTVGRLIRSLDGLDIKLASPSEATRALCSELQLPVVSLDQVDQFDLAFDGCDSLDHDLNALKSNGGIHTFEKLYAQKANKYIIMAPSERYTANLNSDVPLTLEVLDLAIPQILTTVEALGGKAEVRQSSELAGMVRTANGNGLVDCHFADWSNIDVIDGQLAAMTGVMGTSYFKDLVTDALLADAETVQHLTK